VSLDLDRAFTSELSRRAAAHLCDRLEAPSADISATRAAGTGDVAPLVSRRQHLRDRAIALAMQQTQPAGPVIPGRRSCAHTSPLD
jgi:hypothetical protein